ncbi:MAG TPA: tetratricopeptide repeat protein [Candidatus Tidjanibacter gallistercoris]|nr:tetratricopeptide repeat protein [Candidatus Tidjanibacter gallistercoris]
MKKIKFLLAAAALFAATGLSAQTVSEVNTKYNEAAALIQAKDFGAAIPVLEQTIEMGLNAGADASATVQQAQKLLPTCYFQYGLSLCMQNRFDEALTVLDSAVQYAELFQDVKVLGNSRKLISQTYTVMGADAFNNQQWDKAIEIFSKGYEANPTDTDLALYLAESYAASGDYENGMKIYRDIVELESRHSRYKEPADAAREKIVYYQTIRASEAVEAGNIEEAYTVLGDILSVDPDNAAASLMRIQVATNNKDWARVIEWGDAAAEAQTNAADRSDIYYMLGAAYQNSENKDAAVATYRKVTEGDNVANAKAQIEILTKA